ncbi:MAG: peptide ABC transporter substrate-binding protein [Candidatus Faecivivens sp.]|nr:peptide ABC transporter substrate-binding protein [Oscillospiraceae bacterium]MDY2713240.1 peptide ABC transporter substrate-binding protein [Candidatus Faecivivens sp.]
MKAVKITSVLSTIVILASMMASCGGSGSTASTSSESSVSGESSAASSSAESSAEAATGSSDSVVTVAYTTAWDSLMPYNSSSGSMYNLEVLGNIYDRLAYSKLNGDEFTPRGASSWESADDNQAIVFHLDENATWSDGEPVTASDWVYTLKLVSDPSFTGTSRSCAKTIAGTDDNGVAIDGETFGAEAVDDYTLKLTLKTAATPEDWLLANNRNFFVLPEHCLTDYTAADVINADFWTAPVGSGPLKFESEVIGSELVLDARPEYQLGAPGFGKMVCTVMDSSNTMNAIIAGDIDLVCIGNRVLTSNIELAEASGLEVKQFDQATQFNELLINNSNITDYRIREALWYALDKDTITSVMTDGYGVPVDTYIVPGNQFENTDIDMPYDPEKAKELLAEAGYNGETYTMACGSSREPLASLLQQYYDAIGFNMDIALVDVATMFSGLKDGTYDIGVSGHSATASPVWFCNATSFQVLAGEGSSSYAVTDPKFGEYFDQINSIFTTEERLPVVKEFQAYIAEQVPFIPLWYTADHYIESTTVSGVDYGGSWMCNDNVWDWVKE